MRTENEEEVSTILDSLSLSPPPPLYLYHLTHAFVPHVWHHGSLFAFSLFSSSPVGRGVDWSVPLVSFPILSQLLSLPAYRHAVIAGLSLSVGGLTESTVKASKSNLLEWARRTRAVEAKARLAAGSGEVMVRNTFWFVVVVI